MAEDVHHEWIYSIQIIGLEGVAGHVGEIHTPESKDSSSIQKTLSQASRSSDVVMIYANIISNQTTTTVSTTDPKKTTSAIIGSMSWHLHKGAALSFQIGSRHAVCLRLLRSGFPKGKLDALCDLVCQGVVCNENNTGAPDEKKNQLLLSLGGHLCKIELKDSMVGNDSVTSGTKFISTLHNTNVIRVYFNSILPRVSTL